MMLRLLLTMLAVLIVFVLVRDHLRRRRGRSDTAPPPVTTVRCARCGVHLPTGRALQHVDGRHYCSPEHARDDG